MYIHVHVQWRSHGGARQASDHLVEEDLYRAVQLSFLSALSFLILEPSPSFPPSLPPTLPPSLPAPILNEQTYTKTAIIHHLCLHGTIYNRTIYEIAGSLWHTVSVCPTRLYIIVIRIVQRNHASTKYVCMHTHTNTHTLALPPSLPSNTDCLLQREYIRKEGVRRALTWATLLGGTKGDTGI